MPRTRWILAVMHHDMVFTRKGTNLSLIDYGLPARATCPGGLTMDWTLDCKLKTLLVKLNLDRPDNTNETPRDASERRLHDERWKKKGDRTSTRNIAEDKQVRLRRTLNTHPGYWDIFTRIPLTAIKITSVVPVHWLQRRPTIFWSIQELDLLTLEGFIHFFLNFVFFNI